MGLIMAHGLLFHDGHIARAALGEVAIRRRSGKKKKKKTEERTKREFIGFSFKCFQPNESANQLMEQAKQ